MFKINPSGKIWKVATVIVVLLFILNLCTYFTGCTPAEHIHVVVDGVGEYAITVVWHGAWDSGHGYLINDAVSHNGCSYIAIDSSTNQAPDGEGWTNFWNLMADKGADGDTPVKGVDYFDGADGDTPVKGVDYFDGADGADGDTPVKGVDYFDGADGADGDTPVKGVDYFDGATGAQGAQGATGATGEAGWTYIVLGADQRCTSQTYVDVTGLSFSVDANKIYVYEAWLVKNHQGTSYGTRFSINGPAMNWNSYVYQNIQSGSVVSQAFHQGYNQGTYLGTGLAGMSIDIISGMVSTTASGTMIIRQLVENSSSWVDCVAGSFIRYKVLN